MASLLFLRAFAPSVPSTWHAVPPALCMAGSFLSFKCHLLREALPDPLCNLAPFYLPLVTVAQGDFLQSTCYCVYLLRICFLDSDVSFRRMGTDLFSHRGIPRDIVPDIVCFLLDRDLLNE